MNRNFRNKDIKDIAKTSGTAFMLESCTSNRISKNNIFGIPGRPRVKLQHQYDDSVTL